MAVQEEYVCCIPKCVLKPIGIPVLESEREIRLYKICLERVGSLLKKGAYKHCPVNPFSNLPSMVINELMELFQIDGPTIDPVLPLLKSGSLTHLTNLNGCLLLQKCELFEGIMKTNSLRNLRVLKVFKGTQCSMHSVEKLILSCPKLEELHCCKFIDLNALKNCKELRVLRFNINMWTSQYTSPPENFSALSSLKNLQKIYFEYMSKEGVADLLKHCPQLISIGYVDSLSGLGQINVCTTGLCETDDMKISHVLQLRKCMWGKTGPEDYKNYGLYRSSFPEKIRHAISLCPFVEDLIIHIAHPDAIESLKNLKHLVNLKINFRNCNGDFMTSFLALMKLIGSKLRYLCIKSRLPIPVDIICECCPRLVTFEVVTSATATWPAQTQAICSMRKLRIRKVDQNALLVLLSNCKNLEELALCDAACLDDSLLDQILKKNPFAKLKICDISVCSLSLRGYRRFLENTTCLERVQFEAFQFNIATEVKRIIAELKLKAFYGEMDDLPHYKLGFDF